MKFCSGCASGIAVEGKKHCQKCLAAGKHRPQRVYPEQDAWYGRAAWKRARLYKLRRFPMCEECHVKPATDVHHKVEGWKAGANWRLFISQETLAALCHECHSRLTMKTHLHGGNNVHHT